MENMLEYLKVHFTYNVYLFVIDSYHDEMDIKLIFITLSFKVQF